MLRVLLKTCFEFELNSGPFKVQTTTFQQQIEHHQLVTQKTWRFSPCLSTILFRVFLLWRVGGRFGGNQIQAINLFKLKIHGSPSSWLGA